MLISCNLNSFFCSSISSSLLVISSFIHECVSSLQSPDLTCWFNCMYVYAGCRFAFACLAFGVLF